MRARLLDLGSVTALRSQSIGHALADCQDPASEPAVVVMRPASPCLALPGGEPPEAWGGAERGAGGVPVLRHRLRGVPRLVDERQLVFGLVAPAARAAEIGLAGRGDERLAALAAAAVEAHRGLGVETSYGPPWRLEAGGREIGALALGELGRGLCLAGEMVLDRDERLVAAALAPARAAAAGREVSEDEFTSLGRELGEPPAFAAAAEALVAALEEGLALELIPSLPTPDEMEAIYDWDRRLAASEAETLASAARAGAAP